MEPLRPALLALRNHAARRWCRSVYQHQWLHSSAPRPATPLSHPPVPGPPPATAAPHPADALERVARKRRQANLLKQAHEVRAAATPASKPKSMLQRRFWKDVVVREGHGGLQIFLDSKPVRTPNKQILTIPPSKPQLATAVALEWDLLVSAQQALKTHYIPMTSLAARALDIQAADAQGQANVRTDILTVLMRYLHTDTLLCWAPEKVLNDSLLNGKTLRQLQDAAAVPIIAYLQTHVWPGVELNPVLDTESIIPVSQPETTQQVIRGWMASLPAFELAGLERAVLASKSLLVSARLVHQWGEAFAQAREHMVAESFGIEEAAEACSQEVRWQTLQWGEVEDTHDVEKEDLRRQLGSTVILVGGASA